MIHLVLGGARSGKSRYAEKLAKQSGKPVIYVATATVGDSEMTQRIAHHRLERPKEWQLIEEPFYLSRCLGKHQSSQTILLIECITLWLSNWLCAKDADAWQAEKESLLNALAAVQGQVIIVSNEVGSGIVPLGKLSRQFVDQAGWLNQELAALASRVDLVVAGIGLNLKGDSQ